MKPLVSIIIPCFNAELYIKETLTSILSQGGVEMQIVVIDDGSKDRTPEIIADFKDDRVSYFYQTNSGVSCARNKGLAIANGEYVIFFDADDIMPSGFILSRLEKLRKIESIDFVSGEVKRFNSEGFIGESIKGPDSQNLEEQILLYDSEIAACPANIILKREFIIKNKIRFNESLGSTADRYFLLECNSLGKVRFCQDTVPLHYRVSDQSMSNLMTVSLVQDNEMYYKLLKSSNLIPKEIRNISLFLGDFILFGSYWKVGKIGKSIKFGFSGFFRNPIMFIKKLFN